MKPDTERWLRRAEEDLAPSRLSMEHGYSDSCAYHCQQSIEKLLKAALIEETSSYRKVHDLLGLASDLSLELTDDQRRLLGRLTELYIPTRYGDESVELSDEAMQNYYRGTKEFFQWLRQRLK